MFSVRKVVAFLLALNFVIFISCENSSDSTETASTDAYNMALIQSLDDEIQIIQTKNIAVKESDALFSLDWGNVKGHPRIPMEDIETGHAMAVAFSESFSEKPFLHTGGLDMGDVALQTADGAVNLNVLNGRNDGFVYMTAPPHPARGRHSIPDFEPVSVNFTADYDYTFNVSGSDEFTAMDVTLKTPSAKLNITNLTDGQVIGIDRDLNIEWNGASESSPVIVAVLPFRGPREPKEGGRQHGPGGQGHGQRPPRPDMNPDFIRLNMNNHPAIIKTSETNEGSLTIGQQEITALIDSTNAKSLMLHVSAVDATTETINELTVAKVIRMNDRIVLDIE